MYTFLTKKSQTQIGVEMDRRRCGYTFSEGSGVESSPLRHIFLRIFSYMRFQEIKT